MWVVAAAVCYGAVIEVVQIAVPERTFDLWDMVANALGGCVGAGVFPAPGGGELGAAARHPRQTHWGGEQSVFSDTFRDFPSVFGCFRGFSGGFQVFSSCFRVFSGVSGCFRALILGFSRKKTL